jgi:hypothetical protein
MLSSDEIDTVFVLNKERDEFDALAMLALL